MATLATPLHYPKPMQKVLELAQAGCPTRAFLRYMDVPHQPGSKCVNAVGLLGNEHQCDVFRFTDGTRIWRGAAAAGRGEVENNRATLSQETPLMLMPAVGA